MSSACGRLHGIFRKPPSSKAPAATTTTKTITDAKPTKTSNPTTASSTTSTQKRGTLRRVVGRFKKFSESSTFRSRYDIYEHTVKRLLKHNRLSLIHDILDHQKKFPDITNEPFTSHLVCLYGKAGMFDHACKLFDEMPELKCPRTVYSFNALLSACIDAGRFDEMKNILEHLRYELGITLNVVSYNIAIKGFCKMGDFDSAQMMIDEMVKNDVEPDLITFNTLLNGYYLNGKFADGERIWTRMVEMNVVPDIKSYNVELHGLALEKRMKEATDLVQIMRNKGMKLDVFSFNALIRGFVNGENLEQAKEWYSEMRGKCAPNQITFDILIPFLCEKGDVSYAVEICMEIFRRKWQARGEVLQLVVDKLVMETKIQDAEKLVHLGKKQKHHLIIL